MTTIRHKMSDDTTVRDALSRYLCTIELSPDGTVANANDNFLRVSGYRLSDLVGCNYRALCPPDFLTSNQYFELWERLRQGEMVKGLFGRVNRQEGLFWLDGVYIPIIGSDGELTSVTMYGVEESDRAALGVDTRSKWAAIDRTMMVAEYSLSGGFLCANENYKSAFGYTDDELATKHITDFFSECAMLEGMFNRVWEFVSTGNTYIGQLEMANVMGETFWLQSVYTPLFAPSGKLEKVAHFAVDISLNVQRHQTERDGLDDISLILQHTGSGVVVADRMNRITYVNAAFTEVFGYTQRDLKGKSLACVFGPEEQRLIGEFRGVFQTGSALTTEEIVYGKNGQRHYAAVVATPVLDPESAHRCTVCSFTDITYTKMSEVLQYKTLTALGHDIGLREVLKLLCLEAERLLPEVHVVIMGCECGRHPYPLAGSSLPTSMIEDMDNLNEESASLRAIRDRQYVTSSNILESATWTNAASYLEESGIQSTSAMPIMSNEGEVVGTVTFCYLHGFRPNLFHQKVASVVANLANLTMELDDTRASMRQMTFYDPVTSLPNRNLLVTQADQLIVARQIRKTENPMAIMNVNIDRFKRINDSLGFGAGNMLLDLVAKRLATHCKGTDLIGRLTGDEFAMILTNCSAERAMDVARRLQKAVSTPCIIEGEEIIATVSIGISMYPDNGDDTETLLTKASLALANARKTTKTNTFGFFSEQQNERARTPMSLESQLHRAILENGLRLHYQPQIRFDNGAFHGSEALCRWEHPELGMISPATFIPMAEESGMMDELSDWVVREVARQIREWRDRGLPTGHVSLNLSAVSFHDSDLPNRVLSHLAAQGLEPRDVVLELTESVLLDDDPNTMKTIDKTNEMGFSLALDDFGTGYSSLSYLNRLPVETVKLDQSFVRDVSTDVVSRKLSSAIMHLCRELGFTMVVEGVETQAQYDLLKSQGYQVLQGYFISRPLPVSDFEDWLTRRAVAS